MRQRLSESVTGLYDRLYCWMMFTCIVCIMIWCILLEVADGRRK